jgi:DNA transposition AAA+ family ATPase
MNTEHKEQIVEQLALIAQKTSQNKLAVKAGVSSATLSHMMSGKWELIKPELWRKVQSTLKIDLNWKHVATRNFLIITQLLNASQKNSVSIGIAFNEGHGKSHAFKQYDRLNENVIYVECMNHWSKKNFVRELLRACGIDAEGTVHYLIEKFIDHMRTLESPLVIIDQADKLKDPSLDLFMDFYNQLEGNCAFVLSGVKSLQKRIERGVRNDKQGYRELYSRIGRKFIELQKTSLDDVVKVCRGNGIEDEEIIIEQYNLCEGDLRKIMSNVKAYKQAKNK